MRDKDVIKTLASVDECWFKRITQQRFKKNLLRRLTAYYEDFDKGVTIVRTNRNFLVKTIRPDAEFLNKLQSNNFLTDKKRLCLDQLQSNKEKNLELLLSLNFHDKEAYFCFIRCLRETDQHLAAKVLDNGGVVTEAKAICEKINRQRILKQLVVQLNMNDQNLFGEISKSFPAMNEMKTTGLEILQYHQDRKGITVFLWCKTKEALVWLKRATESDVLKEILAQLFWYPSHSVVVRDIILDKNIFSNEVAVFFSIVANFTSRLDLGIVGDKEDFTGADEVMGVTKLENKIHVLLRRFSDPRCVILVFEDWLPFRLQKRIEIKEIGYPADIVSSEMENSLYVLDLKGKCIWKIKGDEKEKKKNIIRWVELGYLIKLGDGRWTLSVTRDGQLLLVSWKKIDPLSSLRVFGAGGSETADLLLSIMLPEDIQRPEHAVETNKGNFIILHLIIKRKNENESEPGEERRQIEEKMVAVSEVSGDGKTILHRFIPKNKEQKLTFQFGTISGSLAVDSFNRVFLTDSFNSRVILLDSHLQWNEILTPTKEDGKEGRRIRWPWALFLDEEKKELIVGGTEEVFVYNLCRE